jgi:hypothetical protein
MNFKKTLLALSLCAVSTLTFSAAGTTGTTVTPNAPSAPVTGPNLAAGVPAYIYQLKSAKNLNNYVGVPFLTNGDRVEANGIGDGNWKYGVSNPHRYVLDFSGATCVDHYGACGGTSGPGEIEANTIVITYLQHVAAPQDPTDSLLLPDPVWVQLSTYQGDVKGVSRPLPPGFESLFTVENNKVKQTITFPTRKFSKLMFNVGLRATDGLGSKALPTEWYAPAIAEVEVFNATPAPSREEIRENDTNDSLEKAQAISPETKVIRGDMGPYDTDFFKFVLPAGKTMNWALEPNLRLLDGNPSDYDLYLYDEAGGLLDFSTNGGNAKEVVSFSNASAANERVLRVEVRYKSGLRGIYGDYKLNVSQ